MTRPAARRPPARAGFGRRGRVPRWVRLALLLAPAMTVVIVLFGGGLGEALAQSLGCQPYLPAHPLGLDAYRQLFTDPAVTASIGLTLRIGAISTAAAMVLGVGAALLVRSLGRARRGVAALLALTLPVPHLVAALAMTLLLSQSGALSRLGHALGLVADPAGFPALTQDGFGWGVIASYVWKEAPFLAVITLAALTGAVGELEDAARTLGASAAQRLRHVLIPALTPAVAAGAVLVFAFTVGSYEVPFLLGRPYPATLAVVAYQRFRDPDLTARPLAMAISVLTTLLTGACVVAFLALTHLLRRRPR